MCVCQMLEDHRWGHQTSQFLLLAVFCHSFAPSSNWYQKHFLRRSHSAGQLLPCLSQPLPTETWKGSRIYPVNIYIDTGLSLLLNQSLEDRKWHMEQKASVFRKTWKGKNNNNCDGFSRVCHLGLPPQVLCSQVGLSLKPGDISTKRFWIRTILFPIHIWKKFSSPARPLGVSLLLLICCYCLRSSRTDFDTKD